LRLLGNSKLAEVVVSSVKNNYILNLIFMCALTLDIQVLEILFLGKGGTDTLIEEIKELIVQ
jgi:hypothetical protein